MVGRALLCFGKISPKVFTEFLFFLLKSQERRIMRLRVGSGLPNIQKMDIGKFEVRYPVFAEQKRIAKTLNIGKQEINLIKQLTEQYRMQKRGLMQKLLTGNWKIQ